MPVTSPGPVQDVEYIGSWFGLELDNGIEGFWKDISGLGIEIEVIEITDSKNDTTTRKRPGTTKYQELSLKRTLGPDKKMWEWVKSIRDGTPDFRTKGAIVLYDIAGTEIGRWTFDNAWPSKWSASDLDVGSDDPIQEEVTLQVELLEREKYESPMPGREHDSDFQGPFFALEIDAFTLAYFTGCSGLSLEFDVTTFKEGNGSMAIEHKRPGKPKYSEVVLKRGFSPDDALYKWFDSVIEAKDTTPYKTASIVIYDRTQTEVARFNLEQCWPSQLSVSDLSAGSDEVMLEEVTIQHELLNWT